MMDTQKNQRIFPRAERTTPAWYQLPDGKYRRCVALDIGVGGACLLSEEPLKPHLELEVCFELSADWTVRATARPVWQKEQPEGGFLVGITYRPLRSADKHLIGPWVHRTRRELQEPASE